MTYSYNYNQCRIKISEPSFPSREIYFTVYRNDVNILGGPYAFKTMHIYFTKMPISVQIQLFKTAYVGSGL